MNAFPGAAPECTRRDGESTGWVLPVVLLLLGILVVACLYILNSKNYPLFHSLIGGFTIVVATSVFVVAWNVRRLLDNDYLVFMGIALLFVAFVDLLHVLGIAGMGVFPGANDNLSTQFWIGARYMESVSLLIAPVYLHRRLNAGLITLCYALVTVLLLLSIFSGFFPDCYVAGKGLTPFKIASEYVISAILAAAWFVLYKNRSGIAPAVYRLVSGALVVTIASEVALTLYSDVHGLSNFIGHLLKLVSYYLIYKAIVETGLVKPFDLLFRNLKTHEAALSSARDELERRVAQRTSQLVAANKSLRSEIAARDRSEHALAERTKELNCLSKLSGIAEQDDISMEEMFERIASLLPEGWQFTSSAVARIRLDGGVYESGNMENCDSVLMSHIKADGKQAGSVQVGYLHEFPDAHEGPFLKEERQLIGIVAERLGHVIDRRNAQRERTLLETQLRQAQKLESVGRLAGGVAHDFNNMLGIIQGNLELALEVADPSAEDTIALKQAHKAGERAAALTHQLLAFARRQTIEPRTLDLNKVVAGMTDMLQRLIGENIDLQWLPAETPAIVKMDTVQIDQILMNLLVNARDAIGTVGRIELQTDEVVFDESFVRKHAEALPGRYVLLAVSDNGTGMDKETLGAIFEPFFTTKPREIGTGLGLSTIYGIVKQNDGLIEVESEPGRGTTFKIYLPAGESDELQEEDLAESVEHESGCNHETVLLVEDDRALLRLATRFLEQLGYAVLPAESPVRAIEIARNNSQLGMLMTDVIMPEMNGNDLLGEVRKLHPDIGCLFVSGYTADVISDRGSRENNVNFLQKPYTKSSLAKELQEVFSSCHSVSS